ncbi:MAG TPA: mechanosensitive ion channel family protein [Aggregicoccus sp.]|nr:mechanosensitive ion channel family protein [Aggregicoccus sp.]
MLPFLQSNLSLVAGALLAVALLAIRATTPDATFKRDLRGALALMLAFVGFRVLAWLVPEASAPSLAKALRVAWMLTFAYGVTRIAVSLGLKLLRLRSPVATPKILRDVIDFTLYALATVPILQSQLNLDLTGLVATSAVLSVVIGLALQDTLGNLFSGLSLQLERPFQVGDFVRVGEHAGVVAQIGWRATRIENFRREAITLPNSLLGKQPIKNYSRGGEPIGQDHFISLSHEAPPNVVKSVLMDVVRGNPLVLEEPPPSVRTYAYEEASIKYMIRYFVSDYLTADPVMEDVYSRLWYRLRREGIDIPIPQRSIRMQQPQQLAAPGGAAGGDYAFVEALQAVDIFAPLPPAELERLQQEVVTRRFGRGETIIQEGESGHTFYLVASGEVSVRTTRGAELSRLKRGQYFGEMSLLTGEARSATVVAVEDAVLFEFGRPTFARLFAEHPKLARQLSALLAQRRSQLRAVAEHAGSADAHPEERRIFARLRHIFGLSHD